MSLHRLRLAARPLAPLLALAFASAVQAQSYTVNSITANTPSLGKVASAATGDTVFTVSASTGAVSVASGTGVRVTTGTTRATVTVGCGNFSTCTNANVQVRIGIVGTPTGRARALTTFNVASGTATLNGAVTQTNANQIDFRLNPIPRSSTRTFYVGMNFPIAADNSGLATGSATSRFYVYVAAAGTTPSTGSTAGTAIATVYRPISMSVASGLAFGRVVRPASGSGTVTVDATNGTRTVSAGAALNSPSASRAVYNVTGEGGQTFSVAVPATFAMTRTGGGSLTVSTSTTATASQALTSAIGSAGSYTFYVGGSFPLTSTTQTGAYSGSFNVTVQYN